MASNGRTGIEIDHRDNMLATIRASGGEKAPTASSKDLKKDGGQNVPGCPGTVKDAVKRVDVGPSPSSSRENVPTPVPGSCENDLLSKAIITEPATGQASTPGRGPPSGPRQSAGISGPPAHKATTALKLPTDLAAHSSAAAGFNNSGAPFGHYRIPIRGPQQQLAPRVPQGLLKPRPAQPLLRGDYYPAGPAPDQYRPVTKPGSSSQAGQRIDSYRPATQPVSHPAKAPSQTPSSEMVTPLTRLSIACQARGHNLEWIRQSSYHPHWYCFSVKANGKIYTAPGGFPDEQSAKKATAQVALLDMKSSADTPITARRNDADSGTGPSGTSNSTKNVKSNADVALQKSAISKKKQNELMSILKQLQAVFGSEMRDLSPDPPEIKAAFLEGLSAGSRISVGNLAGNNTQASSAGTGGRRDAPTPRRHNHGSYHGRRSSRGHGRPQRTRSRSPVKERRQYRDRTADTKPAAKTDTSSCSIIKKEESSSPISLHQVPAMPPTGPRGRGSFLMDHRWDHDAFAQHYSSRN